MTGENVRRECNPIRENNVNESRSAVKYEIVWRNCVPLECSSMHEEQGEIKLDQKKRLGLKCHSKKSRMYSIENWGATKGVQPGELIMISTVLRKIILSAVYRIK